SIRGGRHVGDKSFFPDTKNEPEPNGQDYAEAFVAQHYLGKNKPDIIISNFPVHDALKEALEGEHGKQMQFVTKTIGERKVWLKMAEQNAQMAIAQRRLQQSSQQHRIDELAKILNMNSDDLNRLECFDISHTQGEATIASCVVYDEQNIQPSQYRRYNITTAKPGDDYAAMREVLTRRYGKMQEAEANGEAVK
ncbi:excinuclease ABC subunit UvrC, partial [Neisseria sp. P0024.S002]